MQLSDCNYKGVVDLKRIVLCFPNNGAAAKNVSMHLPLSVLMVASVIDEDYDVKIFDGRLQEIDEFLELCKGAILVGISAITSLQIRYGIELSKYAKEMGITTVWGGTHASLLPEQTLKNEYVDYVIKGEGEEAIKVLADSISNNIFIEDKIIEKPISNLGIIPDIPYYLVDMENYVTTLHKSGYRKLAFLFSRGCPFNCGYCSSGYLTKKWKSLDVKNALIRLNKLVKSYNLDYIEFFDENLTSDISLLEELAEGLPDIKWMIQARLDSVKKLNLKKLEDAGLDIISSGLESGSPRILKLIKKGERVEDYIENNKVLAKSNINAKYSFMMGFPTETFEELMMTIDLALKILEDNSNVSFNPFYVFQPYPVTPLAKKFNVKGYNSLEKWADFGRHNYDTPFVGDKKEIFEKISFSSKYVGRLFPNMFPNDLNIKYLEEEFKKLWYEHDFSSNKWDLLYLKHKEIIVSYFGEHAY